MKRKIILLSLIPLLAGCGNESPVEPVNPTPEPEESTQKYGPCKETYYYLTSQKDFAGNFTITYSDDFRKITKLYSDGDKLEIILDEEYKYKEDFYYALENDVEVLTHKYTYEYNDNDLLTSIKGYFLCADEMVFLNEDSFEYDEKNRMTMKSYSYYDGETQKFEYEYIVEYEYNENETIETYYGFSMEHVQDFHYSQKMVEEINESENEKYITYYTCDSVELDNYEFDCKETYDLTNGLIQKVDYFEGDHIPCTFVYTYNENDELVSIVDTGSNLTRINEYVYDEETGFLVQETYSTIRNQTKEVANKRVETYTTDENGVILSAHMVQEYDGVVSEEEDYTYSSIAANYYLPISEDGYLAKYPGHYTYNY